MSKLTRTDDPSFKTLIEAECYIDKTVYLDKLTQRKAKFYFLSSPQRFGQTLLVDTLEELFKHGGRKTLFVNTKIYRQRPGRWSHYPTI